MLYFKPRTMEPYEEPYNTTQTQREAHVDFYESGHILPILCMGRHALMCVARSDSG